MLTTRSERPANEREVSETEGRQVSTSKPPASARLTAALHTEVFPIPGSPLMTSAAGPTAARSKKRPTARSSSSRPMTSVSTSTFPSTCNLTP
jgi:hypothetical protein